MSTCLVVMGVSGAGKSTLARPLAARLCWPVAEADDFHPDANIAKMASGVPLTDADRAPWLAAIRDWINAQAETGPGAVVTCSALKRRYRDSLRAARARVRFVHLEGSRDVIAGRLATRTGHFMPPSLLESQFGDLEPLAPDEDGVTVDVGDSPQRIIEAALALLRPRDYPASGETHH
ncbi:gluconokinase [Saccharomonospora amisosensis]|uniref:Gluconokinase n=2 Tax=Saccharomonospora amisosensis TaxID=1128677 RepID=A0A7X5UR54_9PSEU|nr:gluconokinase [Saccharomonospora amisosensis]